MATQNDDAVCDVQFSLRVPKSMAEEITARAQADGIKPASWIRKAISKAIIEGDTAAAASLKADLLALLQTDNEVQAAVLGLTGLKDSDRERMREMENRFKRLRKVSENRLTDLIKQKKAILKEQAATEKQIASLISEIDKLHLAGADADSRRLSAAIEELKIRRGQLEGFMQRLTAASAAIETQKTELIALVTESEQAKVMKKYDAPPSGEAGRRVWQNDLERMEIQETMEDDKE
ncbi:MAG: hypothetical protein Q4Q04_04750 [Methanocorpusculum sp.]|nr:hypothetical protein [Methanocorpusculum sp.]